MTAPVVHVEVRGLDTPALKDFYSEVFGWERDESLSSGDYSVSVIGEGRLTAATGPVPPWSARSCRFYIQVEDIEQTLRAIVAAGGQVVMPRTESPEDFPAKHIRVFTSFVDPAGNVIGLVESADAD